VIDAAFTDLAALTSTKRACAVLGKSRATHYRRQRPRPADVGPRAPRSAPPGALTEAERATVLATLNHETFVDKAPAQVWATLLDEGTYLCSESTMYRILRQAGSADGSVRERRRQATHPPRTRPELVADGPGQVWSWDITKLHGPAKGVYYDLYVIIDIYSRYVPGWLVAPTETGDLAKEFIAGTITAAGAAPRVVHADRGTSMTSKPVALLLADLGVIRSHSRPKVSNDNPFSEAAFKTLKYCPAFPERFTSIADARTFCAEFFAYYNHQHRHSGIGLHTPASVHHGSAKEVQELRAEVLTAAHARHPHRFRRPPQPPALPDTVWINRPTLETAPQQNN
jgi:putative transposase